MSLLMRLLTSQWLIYCLLSVVNSTVTYLIYCRQLSKSNVACLEETSLLVCIIKKSLPSQVIGALYLGLKLKNWDLWTKNKLSLLESTLISNYFTLTSFSERKWLYFPSSLFCLFISCLYCLNVSEVFLFVFSFDQLKTAVVNLKKQANKKNEGSLAYVKGGLSTFFEAQDALSGKDALQLLSTV